jgi:multiple sugar transport system substrate-binding protein
MSAILAAAGKKIRPWRAAASRLASICALTLLAACSRDAANGTVTLNWYVFDEPSGAFAMAARHCSDAADGEFRIVLAPLPVDADQQREQLARRLAARDPDIDLIGMDVIWTAEFSEAGWILPWPKTAAEQARAGRLDAAIESASWRGRLWAAPFTSNTQLLWYRSDRVAEPPADWTQLIDDAETRMQAGVIQIQGARYEGLTVFFTSLLASAGGAVLDPTGREVSLAQEPTYHTLTLMRRLARSPASDPALATAREDDTRRAFETGGPIYMVNYTYVWPSAARHAPEIAARMAWARWPSVHADRPSRVTIGGINLGVGAFSRRPDLAFAAATCLASEDSQRMAARLGGLPPSSVALYEDPAVRDVFPFADILRDTLRDAVQRAQSPLYADISLAISHTLHPMRAIDPDRDVDRLRAAVSRALRSEGLL